MPDRIQLEPFSSLALGISCPSSGSSQEVLREDLAPQGIMALMTPLRRNMKQYHPQWNRTVSRHWQLVETVIGH